MHTIGWYGRYVRYVARTIAHIFRHIPAVPMLSCNRLLMPSTPACRGDELTPSGLGGRDQR